MSRMVSFVLMGSAVVFSACPKQDDFSDEGREAAVEFCTCYKKNTKEECLENLKDKYGAAKYLTEEFIDAFNETSSCGIELIIEQEKSASHRMENKVHELLFLTSPE